MKNIIIAFFIIVLLCGCTAPHKQETVADSTQTPTEKIEIKESIPPFEKKEREILPLLKTLEFTNSMEFLDSLITNYEVIHYQKFETDFVLDKMQAEKCDDGYTITSIKSSNTTMTSNVNFAKPLNEYFNTPDNCYGVLVRFKTNNADELKFNFDSKFGRIMLDFTDGIYPSIDVTGDFYGDPMYSDDWNNYVYEHGEWAYVFLTISNVGQKSCYIWAEDNPNDYNFHISYGEDWGGENPYKFAFEVYKKGESITISDIWLYSYEEAKR